MQATFREYLTDSPTRDELVGVMAKLAIDDPKAMMRVNDALFEELGLVSATRDALLDAMVAHPKLIERPIVIRGARAVIARPARRVEELLGSRLRATRGAQLLACSGPQQRQIKGLGARGAWCGCCLTVLHAAAKPSQKSSARHTRAIREPLMKIDRLFVSCLAILAVATGCSHAEPVEAVGSTEARMAGPGGVPNLADEIAEVGRILDGLDRDIKAYGELHNIASNVRNNDWPTRKAAYQKLIVLTETIKGLFESKARVEQRVAKELSEAAAKGLITRAAAARAGLAFSKFIVKRGFPIAAIVFTVSDLHAIFGGCDVFIGTCHAAEPRNDEDIEWELGSVRRELTERFGDSRIALLPELQADLDRLRGLEGRLMLELFEYYQARVNMGFSSNEEDPALADLKGDVDPSELNPDPSE